MKFYLLKEDFSVECDFEDLPYLIFYAFLKGDSVDIFLQLWEKTLYSPALTDEQNNIFLEDYGLSISTDTGILRVFEEGVEVWFNTGLYQEFCDRMAEQKKKAVKTTKKVLYEHCISRFLGENDNGYEEYTEERDESGEFYEIGLEDAITSYLNIFGVEPSFEKRDLFNSPGYDISILIVRWEQYGIKETEVLEIYRY